MNSRSSSETKKQQDNTVKRMSLPEPKVLESIIADAISSNTVAPTVINKNSSNNALENVASNAGVILEGKEKDYRFVKGRSSILADVEKTKDEPLTIYWMSKEARNLFRPLPNETVREAIENQIQLLVGAFNGNNWKSIVDPAADLHKEYYLVPGSVADLKEQAMALSVALDLAKRDKPAKTWATCCEEAVSLIYGEENLIATDSPPPAWKLQEWYREFREHRFFLSKVRRKEILKEKRDETARLKRELAAAKQQNAVLFTKINQGLSRVATSKEAVDLLAEIEMDLSKIKIED